MSAIAPGTRCHDCWVKGHFCQALVEDGSVALCAACDEGVPCNYLKKAPIHHGLAPNGSTRAAIAGGEPEPVAEKPAAHKPGRGRRPAAVMAPKLQRAEELLKKGVSITEVVATTGLSRTATQSLKSRVVPKPRVEWQPQPLDPVDTSTPGMTVYAIPPAPDGATARRVESTALTQVPDLESPSCSDANYDAVIGDIEGKIAALAATRDMLKVLRGASA